MIGYWKFDIFEQVFKSWNYNPTIFSIIARKYFSHVYFLTFQVGQIQFFGLKQPIVTLEIN